ALGVGSVLNNLSLLMQDQSEYADAIAYAEQAWAIFKELDDLQGIVHVLYNIGAMTYDQGNTGRARVILEEALELAQKLGDQRVEGGLLLNLGLALTSLGQCEAAHVRLDESLALMTHVGDKQHLALVRRALARLALVEGRVDDGLALIEESLSYLRQPKGDVYLGQALSTKGELLRAHADLDAAAETFREALALLIKIRQPQPIAEALYCLAGTTFKQGQIERAERLIAAADAIAQRFDLRFPNHPEAIDRAALNIIPLDPALGLTELLDFVQSALS
ncbi:MAG: tetratricopeptide repeat protein, partial [Chloroflexota bacterium]